MKDVFGVRCPASISKKETDQVKYLNDFENGCTPENVNESAFCGKCSKRNSGSLFKNLNSSLIYSHVRGLLIIFYLKKMVNNECVLFIRYVLRINQQ